MAINNDEFISDELLSGYLDNELTADERSRVESTLKSSERHRQILVELRTLRDGLGSLPQHHVDADFQRRVMDRIANMEDENNSDAEEVCSVAPHGSTLSAGAYQVQRRTIMSLAAIAASLLVAFVLVRGKDPRVAHDSTGNEFAADKGEEVAHDSAQPPLVDQSLSDGDGDNRIDGADDIEADSLDLDAADEGGPGRHYRFHVPSGDVDDDTRSIRSRPSPPTPSVASSRALVIGESLPSRVEIEQNAAIHPDAVDAVAEGSLEVGLVKPEETESTVSFAPKQMAQIVRAVQQDEIDVVLELRTNLVEDVVASLSTDLEGAINQEVKWLNWQLEESDGAHSQNRQHFSATMSLDKLRAITRELEESGTIVSLLDSSTVLATLAQPEVRNWFSLYYAPPTVESMDSYESLEAGPKNYDLFVDLDAESPDQDEEARIGVLSKKLNDDQIATILANRSNSESLKDGGNSSPETELPLRVLFVVVVEQK